MFLHHCTHCGRDYLVGTRSLVSFHNTSDGPVGYVRCPEGHLSVVAFHTDRPGGETAAGPTAADDTEVSPNQGDRRAIA